MRDIEVSVWITFNMPCTGGRDAIFPAGEIFTIEYMTSAVADSAHCRPERKRELEAYFVGEDLSNPKYGGEYTLILRTDDIRSHCELIEELS